MRGPRRTGREQEVAPARRAAGGRARRALGEFGGAFGDLGTFLPHVMGAITVAGLAPGGILFGFGACLIASGLFYGLPIAVQPMKAVSAVLLTSGLTGAEVVAAGLALGLVFLVLGATGAIRWLARMVPQSVTAGLQLGLGLAMAVLGLRLMADAPWLGLLTLALVLAGLRVSWWPAAPAALALAVAVGCLAGLVEAPAGLSFGLQLPPLLVPAWTDLPRALELAVLPQIPLTITNAVIVTAALAQSLFPDRSARVSERNLALSTGIANLALAPVGALPMCHGAGGLQAQHRFGARSGAAPVILGVILLALALVLAGSARDVLAVIPIAAVGALLVLSGGDLALSRRLFDARPSCWPVIGVTAAASLLADPFIGLVCGWLAEALRRAVLRAVAAGAPSRTDSSIRSGRR